MAAVIPPKYQRTWAGSYRRGRTAAWRSATVGILIAAIIATGSDATGRAMAASRTP
jgi:hypothetical protein